MEKAGGGRGGWLITIYCIGGMERDSLTRGKDIYICHFDTEKLKSSMQGIVYHVTSARLILFCRINYFITEQEVAN